ncbi:hypothetical protein B0F90DRAFT_1687774 [Multifurca ochricompacta]|uniref:Uncharacterized protein n=1 Tax=Multifurca ochricompacta TaxID=376703 RepID=A0AAD4MCH9_9AGAM|nr:hypothetical protein B0F90DRAFT_1687774 [Multifurca ochricompacta]
MLWTSLARLKVRLGNATALFPRWYTFRSAHTLVETDDCAIPLKATWSVDELLSSYPQPTISPPVLRRLHILSALIPPDESSPVHSKLTRELEDLVKLVESVRLFNVSSDSSPAYNVVDARVWGEDAGIDLQKVPPGDPDQEALRPAELLSQASRTENSLYVIHSDRAARQKSS